jgi:hypothetical protein
MFQAEPESGTCYPYGFDDTNSPLPGSPSLSPNKNNRKVLNLENLKKDIYQMKSDKH